MCTTFKLRMACDDWFAAVLHTELWNAISQSLKFCMGSFWVQRLDDLIAPAAGPRRRCAGAGRQFKNQGGTQRPLLLCHSDMILPSSGPKPDSNVSASRHFHDVELRNGLLSRRLRHRATVLANQPSLTCQASARTQDENSEQAVCGPDTARAPVPAPVDFDRV